MMIDWQVPLAPVVNKVSQVRLDHLDCEDQSDCQAFRVTHVTIILSQRTHLRLLTDA